MDGKEAPPPPPPQPNNHHSSYNCHFSPSLQHHPPPQPHQLLQDIDWMSLLSCPTGLLETCTAPNNINMASTSQSGGENCEGMLLKDVADVERSISRANSSSRQSRKASRPRFEFQTRSSDDILDDGYRWRKYGQKSVKNSDHPRSYYRCTHHTCNVKKQVQRLSNDTAVVVTTYEGIHNHPCEKLMETLSPLLRQMHFLSRFC